MRKYSRNLFLTLICALSLPGCVSAQVHASRDLATGSSSSISQYSETPVDFESGGLVLKGTLAMPNHDASMQVPAVLLLSGSGPTDRDGNQPGLKTDLLKHIAASLAQQGIASFRYDKRSTRTYQASWPKDLPSQNTFWSWDNFLSDVKNGFLTMKGTTGIDKNKLFILGHSEGGVMALATSSELSPRALILMATPARSLSEVMHSQVDAIMAKQNLTPEQKDFFTKEFLRVVTMIESTGKVPDDVPAGLQALFPKSAGLFLQKDLQLVPASLVSLSAAPALILNGQNDLQVSPELDAKKLFDEFNKNGPSGAKLQIFPGLSHNFKATQNASDPGFDGAVPADVLQVMANWIFQN